MNGEEAYVREVRRHLRGMDPKTRDDILNELRSHIADLVRQSRGNRDAAMITLDPPIQVARRYKQLYGYGNAYKALFVLAAAVLAAFTLPVVQVGGGEVMVPVLVSLVFLSVLVVHLLMVGILAGKNIGLLAGLTACIVRHLLFGVLYLAGKESVVVQTGGLVLFVLTSLLLIVLGYIPGEAKARWTKPSGEI